MSATVGLFTEAVDSHRRGDFSRAESHYREFLATNPGHLDAEYLLGTALLQLGRFAEAVERLRAVAAKRADVPEVHNNLGVALKALGDWENAARSFQSALKANPQYVQALFNLGAVMEHRGLFADAEKCYRRALELQPDEDTRWKLAGALKEQQKWADAEAAYRELPALGERRLDRAVQLAFVLARQEKQDDAAEIYRGILAERPDFAEIHNSLSYVYERQGKLAQAEDAARDALQINPSLPEGHNNLGIALRSRHRLDDAAAAFRQAVALNPNFALAEFNLATTHLLAGEYRAGWPGYEKRLDALGQPPREFSKPRWNGEPIPGKRLLVSSDQGFGDAIQFSRFFPAAKERSGAEIAFECQPELLPLMQSVPGIDELFPDGDALPPFDRWIPLASLPGLLGVTLENLSGFPPIPISFGRDSDSSERSAAGRTRRVSEGLTRRVSEGRTRRVSEGHPESLADAAGYSTGAPFRQASGPRLNGPFLSVGLVWRGNPGQARDVVRSFHLKELRRILDIPGIRFVSLQVGEAGQRELADLPEDLRPISLPDGLGDFAATAEVMDSLDLVITVDTAAAHLAGSLGTETWTLLCHTPDWRWGLTADRTPWYPSMRLFRQQNWGDWAGVVARVRTALMEWIAGNPTETA